MLRKNRYPETVTGDDHMGWLEVYGETEPIASSRADTPAAAGHLYEYCWSLSYSKKMFKQLRDEDDLSWLRQRLRWLRRRLPLRRRDKGSKRAPQWADDPAAHVSLYFAAETNWRVSAILATVKHLSPVEQERTWRDEVARDFTAIEPAIGVAGKVAAEATGMPELGSVAEAVSRLKLTSVPQATGTKWFVRKVDLVQSGKLFYGIEWELSLGLLKQLGNRVTGGLLVSFTSVQPGANEGELLARAVMHRDAIRTEEVWLPPKGELKLCLEPKQPSDGNGQATPNPAGLDLAIFLISRR